MAETINMLPSVVIMSASKSCSGSRQLLDELLQRGQKLSPDGKPNIAQISHSGYELKNFDFYPLQLDTKYYCAEVQVCLCQSPNLGSAEFADSVEAVIIHFGQPEVPAGGLEAADLATVERCLAFAQHWDAEIKLLTCQSVPSGQRERLMHWCVTNGFELIELQPDAEALAELEEFGEKFGVDRILQQSLAASIASKSAELSPDDDDAAKTGDPSPSKPDGEGCRAAVDKLVDLDCETALLALDNCEDGDMSFEQLFERFQAMKQRADDMPVLERKKYAEKITVAFWKAIGGDESEVSGIDSSEGEDNGDIEGK